MMADNIDDDESRTNSLGRKRSQPSSSQVTSRQPSSSPERENGPMQKRSKLDVNATSDDGASKQPHEPRETHSNDTSRLQGDGSLKELQSFTSGIRTNGQKQDLEGIALESGLEDMAVQTRAMAAASGDKNAATQHAGKKSKGFSREDIEPHPDEESNARQIDQDLTTAKAKGPLRKYSNEQLAAMREEASVSEDTRERYILAFEMNRAYDILCSPFQPKLIPDLCDQSVAVFIRSLTGKTKKRNSRLAPGPLTKHLNISIAQKASDGLLQYHSQSLAKNKQHLTLLIYATKAHADAALACLLGGGSKKRTGHIESARILEDPQEVRGFAFNSFRLHCVLEFAQARASNIQQFLKSGHLQQDDYGAFHDPPDWDIRAMELPSDIPTLSKSDTNHAELEADESERLRSEAGVATSSEGEISDGGQGESTLITNVTEAKHVSDIDTLHAHQPLLSPSVPFSEMANDYALGPISDIEREKARLFELGGEERELQERYWGLKHPDEFVRCLVCGRQGHMTSACSFDVCAHCQTRNDHLSHTCPLRSRCSRCQHGGHTEHECPFGGKRADSSPYCEKCVQLGHNKEACPHLWRTFYPDGLENVRKSDTIRLSCYQCGGLDHLGGDCSFMSFRQTRTVYDVFSAEEANKYLNTPIASSPSRAIKRSYPPPSVLSGGAKATHQLPKRVREDVGLIIKGAAELRNHDDGMTGSHFPHASQSAAPGRMPMKINTSNVHRDSEKQGDRYHIDGQPRNGAGYNGGNRHRSRSPEPRPARSHRERGPPKNHWPPPPSTQANSNSNPSHGRAGGRGGGRGRGRGRARGRGNR